MDPRDLQREEIRFAPRDAQERLAIEALGTLGLARVYNEAFTEESLSASTGVTLDDLTKLSLGFIPWAEDKNSAWKEKAFDLALFLTGDDPGLLRMVEELRLK